MMDYTQISSEDLYNLSKTALRNIWAFADLIDFRGGSVNFYALQREMAELNTMNQVMRDTERKYRRRIFLIPREHRKTTVNTVLYCLWRMYRNPDIRIIVGCNVKDLAVDVIREMRAYLEDETLIEYVWNARPHIIGPMIPKLSSSNSNYKKYNYTEAVDGKVIWTSTAIQLVRQLKDKQPTLQAVSVGMSPTGKHADLIIFEDIVDWVNSETPEKAKRVNRWAMDIESVVTKKPILVEIAPGFEEWVGNEIAVNGTRYYEWDWYSHHVGNSEAEQVKRLSVTGWSAMVKDVYLNGVDNSGGYICPEIFGEAEEQDMKHSEALTPRVWSAQFRNKIITEYAESFPPENIKVVFHTSYRTTTTPGMCNYLDSTEQTPFGDTPYPIRLYMTVDLAVSMKKGSDRRAIAVGGYDEKRRLHVVESKAGIWTPDELFERISEFAEKWRMSCVYYEGQVGLQDYFATTFRLWLQLHKKPSVVAVPMPVPRFISKEKRLEMTLGPMIQSGNLFVESNVWKYSDIKEELKFFNPASSNNRDDTLDTLEMLARTTAPSGSFRTGQNPARRGQFLNALYGGTR